MGMALSGLSGLSGLYPSGGVSIIGLGSSLVGRWFIGNALTDLSGGGNTATLNGDATYSTTIPTVLFPATHSLSVSGAGHADVGNASSLCPTTAITLMYWCRPAALGGTQYILARDTVAGGNRGYTLGCSDTNITGSVDGSSKITSGELPYSDGTWSHVVMTGDSATGFNCYRDGVEIIGGVSSAWTAPDPSTVNTLIGKWGHVSDAYFNGLIFDARVYNAKLSGEQVALIAAGNG